MKFLDTQPPGAREPLAELRKDADVSRSCRARAARARLLRALAVPAVHARTLILVRGKALNLSVYTQYDGPADLEWIRTITARWIDELKRLNAR